MKLAKVVPEDVRADLMYWRSGRRPAKREELAVWLEAFAGLHVPAVAMCSHHQSPLDYLATGFFEEGSADALVWACRGGGKTMIGAAATLLDLVFKPGIQVRILGGSLEQSEKMYLYLRRMVCETGLVPQALAGPATRRGLRLENGSAVEILAQSDRAVRGQRVQKLRCDEVELFDEAVWSAGQLVTRTLGGKEYAGGFVRGAVEGFSTMHQPGGLMQKLLAQSGDGESRRVYSWCVWDVVAKCHDERACERCEIWEDCRGRAKRANGFVPVADLIRMKSRVSRAVWEHEMLCRPPRFEDAVFRGFTRESHVRWKPEGVRLRPGDRVSVDGRELRHEMLAAGVDFGIVHDFVCLWMLMLRDGRGERVVWVIGEMVRQGRRLAENVAEMRRWVEGSGLGEPAAVYCDVAGNQTNRQTGLTDMRLLRDAGFKVGGSSMGIQESVAVIEALVSPAEGPARLLIDPGCERLIAAMEGSRNEKGRTLRPRKDGVHDHLIDALRYGVVNHDRWKGKLDMRLY